MGWEEGGAIGNRGQSRDWKGVKKGGRREEEGEREGGCHKENGRQEEGLGRKPQRGLLKVCLRIVGHGTLHQPPLSDPVSVF